jgi:hypothetical protein
MFLEIGWRGFERLRGAIAIEVGPVVMADDDGLLSNCSYSGSRQGTQNCRALVIAAWRNNVLSLI